MHPLPSSELQNTPYFMSFPQTSLGTHILLLLSSLLHSINIPAGLGIEDHFNSPLAYTTNDEGMPNRVFISPTR